MSSALFAVILVTMVLIAVVLLVAWWAFASFGRSAGSTGRMQCGYRRDRSEPWSVGTLTYEEDRLIYTRSGGLFASRSECWERFALVVNIGLPVDGADVAKGLRGVEMMSVPCHYGHRSFELAVTAGRYTALRSWVEAVPPGSHANVA
ncbi:MAG: DUF2550 family protein [Ornithinimicrobium sp.]